MRTLIIILAVLCLTAPARAVETAWFDSLPDAMDKASREDKIILMDFTGSDWCPWCQQLVADTFSKREFMDYARRNLVLVEVDFPQMKPQSSEQKDANKALARKYGVKGYPTVVVTKADGSVLWKQRGYLPGGANAMIAAVNKVNPNPRPATPPSPPLPAPAPTPAAPVQASTPPPPKPPPDVKVQGILYSSIHSSAVLDGRTYEEGEYVQGMKILKIARDKVTVDWKGQMIDLYR
jgi:protein disulfide-isomerase